MYRVKETGEVLTKREVRDRFNNIAIPTCWDDNVCSSLGIDFIHPTPKPESSSIITYMVAGEPGKTVEDTWLETWVETDIFEDNVLSGLTKKEQETEYIAVHTANAIADKKQKLKELFIKKSTKPAVDTGLGFSVDGGRINLEDFQTGLAMNFLTIRDASNATFPDHSRTCYDMQDI